MSLRVWLPLNGDLHNQGISNVTATGHSVISTAGGKIGSCYQFTTSAIELDDNIFDNNVTEFTVAAWMKFNNSNSACLFSDRAATNSTGITLFIMDSGKIYYDAGARWEFTPSTAIPRDQWFHIAFLYKKGSLRQVYLNGSLIGSTTSAPAATTTSTGHSFIGASQSSSTVLNGNYFNGWMNDVRIYDHCLSAAEVKEIAQGLVLHYKLDSFQGSYGNKNLLARYVVPGQAAPTSTANGGRTTWLGDYKITIPATESADTYFRLFMTEQLVSGTTYTISCKVSGLLNGSYYRFPLFSQSNASMGVLNLDHNGLCSLTFTMSWTGTQTAATGANGETVYVNFLDDSSRAIATGQGAITLYDFKLEEGSQATPWCPSDASLTQIQDSSGYNHNGTVVGAIEISQDTSRYNTCIHFSANNQYINCSNINLAGSNSTFTFAWWGKCATYTSTMMWGFSNGNRLNGIYSGKTWNTGDGGSNPLYNPGTTTVVTIPTVDEWHHFAMVADGTTCKVYQDGELWGQAKTFKTCTGTNLYLNGWDSGTNYKNTNAFLSDFRIYCTPLLDTDIKQLYNVGMKVDNKQQIHTFELYNKSINLLRTELIMPAAKAGYTSCIGEITTHNNTYAYNIAPAPFYKNISDSESGILKGQFATNTSYILDMWIDVDSVIYNGNNVAGGMTICYTDGTSDNTFVLTGGNKGYQHKILITPNNKTIDRLNIYYYTSTDVFYRADSYIGIYTGQEIKKTGILNTGNLSEIDNITQFVKGGHIHTKQIIER